jgi:hypothetical protein
MNFGEFFFYLHKTISPSDNEERNKSIRLSYEGAFHSYVKYSAMSYGAWLFKTGVNTLCGRKYYMETRYVCRLSDNLPGFFINTTYPITLLGFFIHITFSYL